MRYQTWSDDGAELPRVDLKCSDSSVIDALMGPVRGVDPQPSWAIEFNEAVEKMVRAASRELE